MPREGATAKDPRRRNATKVLKQAQAFGPAEGTRFPSAVLGDNLQLFRKHRDLRQVDLAQLMQQVGFIGWSRVTVSDVERGIRATSVDELFALAIVLNTYVVKLLDPAFSGDEGEGIDVGFAYPEDWKPELARRLVLDEEEPWKMNRQPGITYAQYRKQIANFVQERAHWEMGIED